MNATYDRLVDDLAALWTEPAFEILKASGVSGVSIDMELATWRTLKEVLQSELRWQRAFRSSTLVSLTTLMEQVLRKATLLVARRFAPQSRSGEFANQIQRLVRDRRTTAMERGLYAQMVGQPTLRAAFKPPTRTDYFPRLQVSAVAH